MKNNEEALCKVIEAVLASGSHEEMARRLQGLVAGGEIEGTGLEKVIKAGQMVRRLAESRTIASAYTEAVLGELGRRFGLEEHVMEGQDPARGPVRFQYFTLQGESVLGMELTMDGEGTIQRQWVKGAGVEVMVGVMQEMADA